MHITSCLYLFKLPKGHIFRGKYRLVKRVTKKSVELLRKDFELEEANMFYLRHPYLTPEQSKEYNLTIDKKKEWLLISDAAKANKFTKHRTLVDELSHLRVNENWEFGAGGEIK